MMGGQLDSNLQEMVPSKGLYAIFAILYHSLHREIEAWFAVVMQYVRFFYNCFIKPHAQNPSDQKTSIESFYKGQAVIYDNTRTKLLTGREDMLGLIASQMQWRVDAGAISPKPIWIDVGGGTGYNIEAMCRYVDITTFFEAIVLVDLSPSLTAVAADRVQRMGWKNVLIVCEDARHFQLEDHWRPSLPNSSTPRKPDLITMSYSLSMIPDFYSVVDSLANTLAPEGLIGVADFYIQEQSEYLARDNIGGVLNRHCMWISRVFWRAWFEADRVNLEAGRRDYLEYRFDTITSFNERCRLLGFRIPYYVWIGCPKSELQKLTPEKGSPTLSALDLQGHSELGDSAVDLRADFPTLAKTLQKMGTHPHSWRVPYNYRLQKHLQFGSEYIYAFTWEDSLQDLDILDIKATDSILAITSAGDNILSYACKGPRRIHAVDLNPNQNHLLELKLAAFTSLKHSDIWSLFGQGKHSNFRELLITRLSPHLSSTAFQYWLYHGPETFREDGEGLYYTGGSRHALTLIRWLSHVFGLQHVIHQLCHARTLEEQRLIWKKKIQGVLLSWWLSYLILSNKAWLWRALGVPVAQRNMIELDHVTAQAQKDRSAQESGLLTHTETQKASSWIPGGAIWNYCIDTLDPVATSTHLRTSNHYYLLPLLGHYTRDSHPEYLDPAAFETLSQPGALDCLQIHTDEVHSVLCQLEPTSLTIAVVMDSLDWLDGMRQKDRDSAQEQVSALWRALAAKGRVLLRSAGVQPWYLELFQARGFQIQAIAVRKDRNCIDRSVLLWFEERKLIYDSVNMYASTWLCTKP